MYVGGDDLLVVGPWNVALDFAGDLARTFRDGPGRTYAPLTLSAGITLTPSYQIPFGAPRACRDSQLLPLFQHAVADGCGASPRSQLSRSCLLSQAADSAFRACANS